MASAVLLLLIISVAAVASALQLDFKDCGTDDMHKVFKVEAVVQEPSHPTIPGDMLVEVQGRALKPVPCATFSAQVRYSWTWFGRKYYVSVAELKDKDVCKFLSVGKCPVYGASALAFKEHLPWFALKRLYEIHLTATTCDGQDVACVDFTADLRSAGRLDSGDYVTMT